MQLWQVIATLESSNNTKAVRFEPAEFTNSPSWVTNTIPLAAKFNSCSNDTGKMLCCTSFGMFQIMGFNIYSLGYTKTVFDFVGNLQDQIDLFDAFVKTKGFDGAENVNSWTREEFETFASKYNGPEFYLAYSSKMQQISGVKF